MTFTSIPIKVMGDLIRDTEDREKQPNELYFSKNITNFEKVIKKLISFHDFST